MLEQKYHLCKGLDHLSSQDIDGLQGKWYTLLPHPYYMSHLDNPQVAEQDLNIFYQLDSSDKYFDLHCL